MPAKPLNLEQIGEAVLLKTIFKAWQDRRRSAGENWSQEFAGEQLGFGQSAMNQYLNGKIPLNPEAARKFANLLACEVEDFSFSIAKEIKHLATGVTQYEDIPMFSRNPALIASDNTRPAASFGRVPLISEVQAGHWADICDNFSAGEADEWVRPIASKPGKHAFALEVMGESMTSPFVGPGVLTFPEGTTIIVDPEQAADAGHFVVAKDVSTQKATFKKLMYDGGRWYLKPLNPDYKTVEIDDPAMRVIGRVIEYIPKGGKL